jgi:hypothetical protein
MITKSVIIIAVITTIVTTSHLSWAYDGEVHYMINDAAVESLLLELDSARRGTSLTK